MVMVELQDVGFGSSLGLVCGVWLCRVCCAFVVGIWHDFAFGSAFVAFFVCLELQVRPGWGRLVCLVSVFVLVYWVLGDGLL